MSSKVVNRKSVNVDWSWLIFEGSSLMDHSLQWIYFGNSMHPNHGLSAIDYEPSTMNDQYPINHLMLHSISPQFSPISTNPFIFVVCISIFYNLRELLK